MDGIGVFLIFLMILVLVTLSSFKGGRGALKRAAVSRIIDGDTVLVKNGPRKMTLRLDSIDCPEDGQEWGDTAKYGLIKLIGGRQIQYEDHGLDTYGRTLATLFVDQPGQSEPMNVNVRMIVLGHAWVSRIPFTHLPVDRQKELQRAERWARNKRVGLWQSDFPIPPWKWRKEIAPVRLH